MSNFEMIQFAAKRLAGKIVKTPLLSSPKLDKIAGRPIFVKAECLQPVSYTHLTLPTTPYV